MSKEKVELDVSADIEESFESDIVDVSISQESVLPPGAFGSYAGMYLVACVVVYTDRCCTRTIEALEGAKKAKAQFLEKKTSELLGRITSKMLNKAELWNTYSRFQYSIGSLDKAIDSKLRECRATKVEGWENDLNKFYVVANASRELCSLLVEEGSSRSLKDGQMWLNNILKRTERIFAENEQFKGLQESLHLISLKLQ